MIEIGGMDIKTSQSVYVPAEDTELAISAIEKSMHNSHYQYALDMGTGTGTLGIYAATSGKVDEVTFVDINEHAVSLARQNVEINKTRILPRCKCKFISSNLFSNIKGRYDLIIFNAPYLVHDEKERSLLAKAWDGGKDGVDVSIDFLEQARQRIRRNGRIILVASSHSNLRRLKSAIRRLGYTIKSTLKEHIFFEDIIAYEIAAGVQKNGRK